jgi:N-formylglutamate amidohydrolase
MNSPFEKEDPCQSERLQAESSTAEFDKLLAGSQDLPAPFSLPLGPVREERGRRIVFSAPHQAAHIREGATLPSEYGSAELAFSLARSVGGSAICTADPQSGDPNWDVGHPYCDVVYELADGAPVLDLHKMKPRGVDLCIGLGPHPERTQRLWVPIAKEAVASGLRVAVNWPFAAGPVTVTGQLQARGLEVVQLELSFDCYDPGPVRVAAWLSLLRAVRAILANSLSRMLFVQCDRLIRFASSAEGSILPGQGYHDPRKCKSKFYCRSMV